MLTQEYVTWAMSPAYDLMDEAWLAGAKAGITEREASISDEEWVSFIQNLRTVLDRLPEVQPAEPGTAPSDGSLYDVLGGYVSLTGHLDTGHLSFPVPLIRQAIVLSLFPGMDIRARGSTVSIPCEDLLHFSRLVPIRGPLQDDIGRVCND